MTQLVYKIEFPDGRFYVGATQNYASRRQKHLQAGRKGQAVNKRLKRAMVEFFPVLAICPIAEPLKGVPLHELEEAVIATQQPSLNVNLKPLPIPEYAEQYVTIDEKRVLKSAVRAVSRRTYEKRRRRGWSEVEALLTSPVATKLSATNVAKRYGIDPNTYYQRRHKGWTLYEALGLTTRPTPPKPKVKKRLITIDGKTRTLNAWAELAGITPNALHARLNLGWTERQAVGVSPTETSKRVAERKAAQAERKVTRETYTHRGFTGTLAQICSEFGYTYSVVSQRRYKGKPFEEWFLPTQQPVKRVPLPSAPSHHLAHTW